MCNNICQCLLNSRYQLSATHKSKIHDCRKILNLKEYFSPINHDKVWIRKPFTINLESEKDY